jgi:hypothetical protein
MDLDSIIKFGKEFGLPTVLLVGVLILIAKVILPKFLETLTQKDERSVAREKEKDGLFLIELQNMGARYDTQLKGLIETFAADSTAKREHHTLVIKELTDQNKNVIAEIYKANERVMDQNQKVVDQAVSLMKAHSENTLGLMNSISSKTDGILTEIKNIKIGS